MSCLESCLFSHPVFLPANQPPSTLLPKCQLGTVKAPCAPHTVQAHPLQGARVSSPKAGFCLTQVVPFNTGGTEGPRAMGASPACSPSRWPGPFLGCMFSSSPLACWEQPGGLETSSKRVPGELLTASLKRNKLVCALSKASVSTAVLVRVGWRVCLFCFVLFDFTWDLLNCFHVEV